MSRAYFLTSAEVIDRLNFYKAVHYNKGYERDPATGKFYPDAAHLGYGWEYACVECPRLRFVDYIMEPGQAAGTGRRVWHVDGGRDDLSLEDALIALTKPPLLSLTAFYCLLRIRNIPPKMDPHIWITGAARRGGIVKAGSRQSIWSAAQHELIRKGFIVYRNGELVAHV